MTLSIGSRLGRFEIVGALGMGGMGEVYRARDPELRREVAIKVLPEAFSSDPSRRRRFEQEARAAGGLNHPNILAVYDAGNEDSFSYIVTELLDGATLGERLAGGPLLPEKAADYALQIARGLAAAHDGGVVHRDIKPSNLFLTSDGRVKILDFGLAKLIAPEWPGITETVPVAIGPPAVLGSAPYMSPEQAKGGSVDHRTDIFSFGVVLYEMLAGFPPFRRASSGETVNAIVFEAAPPLPRQGESSAAFGHIVGHCLEKEPADRYQNFRDLIFDLETRLKETRAAGRTLRSRRTRVALAAGVLAATAIGAGLLGRSLATPSPRAIHRVRALTNMVGLEESSAISPDGRMVAFTVVEGERRQIYIRYLTDSPMRPVTSDDADHDAPRWLPNGTSLVYFSPAGPGEVQGAIYRVPALGGAPQRLLESVGGADVSTSGRLVCFRLQAERIQLVTASPDGTDLTPIAEVPTQHYGYPRWSNDGRWIAFQAGDGFRWDVYVVRATPASKPFQITHDSKGIKGVAWLPDSSGVVYASARGSTFPYLPPLSLWEARLDARQRQLTTPEAWYEQPDLHASGLLSVTRMTMRYDIREYPFGGVTTGVEQGRQLTRQTGQVSTPSHSPNGREVAYLSDAGAHANVWVTSTGGTPRQITFEDDPGVAIGVPAWSPDGQWIVYLSSKGNTGLVFGVWLVRPDGSGNHQLLPMGLSPTWSADGKWIYYVETANRGIKRIPAAGGTPDTVRPEPARNVIGVHGSVLYYVVDRALMDGRQVFEVHKAPVQGGPATLVVTIPVSRVPSWQIANPALSPDGRWLAMPLTDGFTTNIWTISTDDGRMTPATNFGARPIFIARRVAWSSDGRSILAAIGEGDADIVLLDGLIGPASRK